MVNGVRRNGNSSNGKSFFAAQFNNFNILKN